jgi:hypothetical protein
LIVKKIRYGQEYDYDDNTKRFYNPITHNWIQKPRPSTKGKNKGKYKGKSIGKNISTIDNSVHHYYDFKLDHLGFSPERSERINFFLSKVERKYQQFNWIKNNNEDELDDNDDEAKVYFSNKEINYLLTADNRNDIIQSLVDNDLIKLNKKEKKYIYLDNRTIHFTNPKILWFFTPTDKMLSREKKKKIITYKRVNNSVNNYYRIIEKNLGDYAKYYRNQYKCKFNITREEFDQVIRSKYYRKNRKCTLDEYMKSSNYLYESIMEWNRGNKYSNLSTYKIDKFSGRVHSLFTQLSTDFFMFNDTFNIEIDLATSQPVMLAHILKQEIGENHFSTDIDIDIYEKIKSYYSLPDRSAAKNLFYKITYGRKTSLKELYPEVNHWVKEKKNFNLNYHRYRSNTPEYRLMKFYNKKGESIKRHSIIALILQELELKIFQRIWDVLHSMDIAFVTRHDSVVINADDLENAKYHIENILDDELCVNYKLRTENFK